MARTYTRRAVRHTPKQADPAPESPHVETAPEPTIVRADPRPEPRVEMRAEDSRAAAEARAAQIFGHVDLEETEDEFKLPLNLAPDGWEYEWKRTHLTGQEDTMHQLHTAQMGWEPVPAERHPSMMPKGSTGAIQRKGMMLMQRPKVVNDRVRQRDHARAVGQVRGREEQLQIAPTGQFDRANKDSSMVRVKTSYEAPMRVPE